MAPLATQYQRIIKKGVSYTIAVPDDVVEFTTTGAGVIATLPLAKDCSIYSGQNLKIVANKSTSTDEITIAVQSGDTLVGVTGASATLTLAVGDSAFFRGNQTTTWNMSGGVGTSGVSGFSGFSGASGYSGASGWSGYSGKSGYSGYCGISGYTGVSGYSGYSGVSGYSGFSGISGYSGFSGYSGYTGV